MLKLNRKNLKILASLFLIFSIFVIAGCSSSDTNSPNLSSEDSKPAMTTPTPTPTPAPAPTPDPEPEGKYVGSISSDKYHYPDCRYAKKIKPANEVWFADYLEAQSEGYQACKVCKPEGYTASYSAPAPAKKSSGGDITVYVTNTGSKYHRDGCRYLSRSQIPISLSEAKAGYDPCSVCDPPY